MANSKLKRPAVADGPPDGPPDGPALLPEPHRPWGVHVVMTRVGETRQLGPYTSHSQALSAATRAAEVGFVDGDTAYSAASVYSARVVPL